ncbi:MAG: bifunctional phosphoribosylaminoimidazolecarboxamide formyltransferase/IMP cyclohydrolase [Acidobacteria bacterium]|nr:bifunctional phosphoribosylaminoimidazolecarboxamide formyltransferase/IMP cyclohydrolase [Acidobacteriota bacterium]
MSRRALVSVSNKSDLAPFVSRLVSCGYEILSTGGTARILRDSGIPVVDVSQVTGFPEIFSGRVKTLHPKIHGGLLARRDHKEDQQQARDQQIEMIDLAVVNLYPFRETVARPEATLEDAIENIDIGGPSMIRSAAKNFRFVTVVVDPVDYNWVAKELESDGGVAEPQRFHLACKAFAHTADYDAHIANYLFGCGSGQGSAGDELPRLLTLQADKVMDLRYGENPHQRAALYRHKGGAGRATVAGAEQLQGKELSFNNYLDLEAAWRLVQEFDNPVCAIIKHNNPCGVGEAGTLVESYRCALATDLVSAFGSVISFNREVDSATADELSKLFVEAIIAPGYSEEARRRLGGKKNLRLMRIEPSRARAFPWDIKSIQGGLLAQDWDRFYLTEKDLKVVSHRSPSSREMEDMLFAWRVCKHVKSNAIVFATGGRTLGIGAGQMSRVDSVRLASQKATGPLQGAVMASDAFFPFRDGLDEAARAGIVAAIEPGGSVRDEEVIRAADEHNMALVFTGIRHFRH